MRAVEWQTHEGGRVADTYEGGRVADTTGRRKTGLHMTGNI